MTRGELISELAASLGARHEARFIVDEVLGSSPPGDDRMAGPAAVETARTLTAAGKRASRCSTSSGTGPFGPWISWWTDAC